MKTVKNSETVFFLGRQNSMKIVKNCQIVQDTLPQTHYDMKGCTILTFKEDLPLLKEKITEYFDNFKQVG